MADALVAWLHLMYNTSTARRVLGAVIRRLQARAKEFDV